MFLILFMLLWAPELALDFSRWAVFTLESFFGHGEFHICMMCWCVRCICVKSGCVCVCAIVHALEEMRWCVWCVCMCWQTCVFLDFFLRFLSFWFLCMATAYMASCGLSATNNDSTWPWWHGIRTQIRGLHCYYCPSWILPPWHFGGHSDSSQDGIMPIMCHIL